MDRRTFVETEADDAKLRRVIATAGPVFDAARSEGDFFELFVALALFAEIPVAYRVKAITFTNVALGLPEPTLAKLRRILAALDS